VLLPRPKFDMWIYISGLGMVMLYSQQRA
jgi:hypothetical protein